MQIAKVDFDVMDAKGSKYFLEKNLTSPSTAVDTIIICMFDDGGEFNNFTLSNVQGGGWDYYSNDQFVKKYATIKACLADTGFAIDNCRLAI